MNTKLQAVAVALMLMLACIGPAHAHARLASAEPAPDAVVTVAPTALTLHFTEAVELDLTGLTVKRDGVVVPQGAPAADPADPSAVSVGFDTPLAPGTYTIDWHTVAADGHKGSGTYGFVVKP